MFPVFQRRIDQVDPEVRRDEEKESTPMIKVMLARAEDRLALLFVREKECGREIEVDWRNQEPEDKEKRPMLEGAPAILHPPRDNNGHQSVHHPKGMDPVA